LKLGRGSQYLHEFVHVGSELETWARYIELLQDIYLLEPSQLSLRSPNDLKKLKQDCYDSVVDTLVDKGMLFDFNKKDFELVFFTLLAILKANLAQNRPKLTLAQLSEKISIDNYDSFLREHFSHRGL
jgi:hypothetical protein